VTYWLLPYVRTAMRLARVVTPSAPAQHSAPPTDNTVSTSHLVPSYERRSSHLAERGISTLSFDEAVEQLRGMEGDVRIGGVHTDGWHFVLFLDPVEPVIVACLAVDSDAANPDWDYTTWQR
jgi:hypothetical protein